MHTSPYIIHATWNSTAVKQTQTKALLSIAETAPSSSLQHPNSKDRSFHDIYNISTSLHSDMTYRSRGATEINK